MEILKKRRVRGAAVALFLGLLGAGQDAELPEYVVKAGFLFNFAKYVEWPADAFDGPKAPIRVGVAGDDPFGATLEKTLKDKNVNGRGFTIDRFKEPADIQRCHILFVARTGKERTSAMLERARQPGMLTVGEADGFAQAGGVVSILIEEGKPKLEVNLGAAQERKVVINAKLLKLAVIVRSER
jgi:hypothetical protein